MLPVRALSTQMYWQLTSNDCGTVSQSLFEMPQDTQAYFFSFFFLIIFIHFLLSPLLSLLHSFFLLYFFYPFSFWPVEWKIVSYMIIFVGISYSRFSLTWFQFKRVTNSSWKVFSYFPSAFTNLPEMFFLILIFTPTIN